jgi:hypothetical protein
MNPATTSRISRLRGWLLIVLGSSLSVGIAVIAGFLALTIMQGEGRGGSHWTGSHEFTVRVFELFATVFVFGLVSVAGGSFQLRHGRANRLAIILMLALVGVMFFLGRQIAGAAE